MKPNSLALLAMAVVLPCLYGCSLFGTNYSTAPASNAVNPVVTVPATREQERVFAGALEYVRTGRELEARNALETVLNGPSRDGITDEALFRLSLLYLRDDTARGTTRSQELLERLRTEFPQSIWSNQSAPLAAYLAGVKNIRDRKREVKSLKELNLSLSRDNREMRQSIERLKNLDLELEQKIKR